MKMEIDLSKPSESWLSEWMAVHEVPLWGIADLRGFATPADASGNAFPRAVSFALPMPPRIMAGILQGPGPAYAEEFTRKNDRINVLGEELELELKGRGIRALRLAASGRIDVERLASEFPHKTAATRAGLGWIGRNCQLVTMQYGPWVRLGTVFTDMETQCGHPRERSSCGKCGKCVEACPAHALKGALWQPGIPREEILDAHACEQWKKEHYPQYLEGRLCGICSSACPFGRKTLKAGAGVPSG
jgi:epoxyqueuosine reductase